VFTFSFDAIGTRWGIETREPLGRGAEQRILGRIQQFDATYSRFRRLPGVSDC
jgi:thiamine biosynthesis lipoprotein